VTDTVKFKLEERKFLRVKELIMPQMGPMMFASATKVGGRRISRAAVRTERQIDRQLKQTGQHTAGWVVRKLGAAKTGA
jgi:hypothetical protein